VGDLGIHRINKLISIIQHIELKYIGVTIHRGIVGLGKFCKKLERVAQEMGILSYKMNK
jgi:hypothetical protein